MNRIVRAVVGLAAVVMAVGPGTAGCTSPVPQNPETLEEVERAAEAADYWASDRIEDGSVTWEDLEWAHRQWRDCVEALDGVVATGDSWVNPVTGYFGGFDWSAIEEEVPSDTWDEAMVKGLSSCDTEFSPEHLDLAYRATHEPVVDPPLLEFVIDCLDGAGVEVDRSRTNLRALAEDTAGEAGSTPLGYHVPLVDGCIGEGLAELYPNLPEFFIEY
ncbi:MAG: hypothetical protein LBK95_19245 [Bifidobacteriaceae bacterium]|jgi:hypothetical protein|nr:hypothetical protein [Bifidobacteriaceae bacterium]